MAMICFLCDTEVLRVETSVSKGLDSVATHSVDHVPKAQIKQAALFKDPAEVLCCFFVNESVNTSKGASVESGTLLCVLQ